MSALNLAILAAALTLFGAAPVGAQTLGFGNQTNEPIYIEAEEEIEWRRKESVYTARGNARASQGGITVEAAILSAYYRKTEAGNTEIYLLQAEHNVRITSEEEIATGETAVFDIIGGILVITGDEVRLVTAEDVIVARDSLEYYQHQHLAAARGVATATRGDKQVRADILMAYFSPGDGGARTSNVERMEAIGNVLISTPQDIVRARRGDYNPNTGIATLTGDVKITRGDSQMNGEFAEVNLNTGISRITGGGKGGGRVKGLVLPTARTRPNEPLDR